MMCSLLKVKTCDESVLKVWELSMEAGRLVATDCHQEGAALSNWQVVFSIHQLEVISIHKKLSRIQQCFINRMINFCQIIISESVWILFHISPLTPQEGLTFKSIAFLLEFTERIDI